MGNFNVKRKKDPGLTRIIVAIIVLGATVAGLLRFSEWFNQNYIVAGVEAKAETDLDNARQLMEEGKASEARQLLRPILARVKNPDITPRALMLQAELEEQAGEIDAALENLRIATEEYKDGPDHLRAATAYARLLEKQGEFERTVEIYAQIRETAPPDLSAAALSGLARAKEREGDVGGALELYEQAVRDAPWDSEAWREAAEDLGRLNVNAVFSPRETPDSKKYRVAQGDSLTNIGIKLNTTQGLLMRANGITDPNRLHLGQSLKYTPKDFRVVIERSTCRLFLLDREGLFKVYRTGLGKPGHATALGKYKIGNKEKDPTWFKPGSKPIPPGDPQNELGTRWMPLIPEEEDLPADLGIHGTIRPETIGTYASLGCPRMFKEDVEELYDLVVRATPVHIVDTYAPEVEQ